VDSQEAGRILADTVAGLRGDTYQALVARYLDGSEHRRVVAESGAEYQLEVQALWDDGTPGNLRVIVSVDDGGWRAVHPLTSDFIIATDGSFVGE